MSSQMKGWRLQASRMYSAKIMFDSVVVVVVVWIHMHWRNWCAHKHAVLHFISFNFVVGCLLFVNLPCALRMNYDRHHRRHCCRRRRRRHHVVLQSQMDNFIQNLWYFVLCTVYKIISLATFMTLLNTINYNCFSFSFSHFCVWFTFYVCHKYSHTTRSCSQLNG